MSSKNTYRLVNPYIEGSLNTVVTASSPFKAGRKLYRDLSKNFTNYVGAFNMSVQNVQTGGLFHFKVDETMKTGSNMVDYNLVMFSGNLDADVEKKLVNEVKKLEQSGGRFYSPDSESTTESIFSYPLQPISRFVYFSLPYYKLNIIGLSPYDYHRLFMPMFSLPINPCLEIRFDIYNFN